MAELSIKKSLLAGLLLLVPALLPAQLPADLEQGFARAVAAYESGDMPAAEKIYRGLIKDYPKLPELYNNLAASLVAQGKSQQAIKVLQSGLRSHSGFASLYDNLLDVNASLSRQHYMQALVPVKQVSLRLQSTSLTDLGELYYASQPPLQIAASQPEPTPRVAVKTPVQKPVTTVAKPTPTVTTKLAQTESLADDVPPVMDMESQVKAALLSWAEAWSRQDVKTYVNAYVKDYRPDSNISHAAWVKQRQQRLKRPKWIKIKLDKMEFFILESGRVAVQLQQSYQSNTYRDVGRKEMLLRLQDGQWKIEKEHSQ